MDKSVNTYDISDPNVEIEGISDEERERLRELEREKERERHRHKHHHRKHHREHSEHHHEHHHEHHLKSHDIHNGVLPHGFHHGHHGHTHHSRILEIIAAAHVKHHIKNMILMERNHRLQIINATIRQQMEDRKKLFVSDRDGLNAATGRANIETKPVEAAPPAQWQEKIGDMKSRLRGRKSKLMARRSSLSK